MLAGELVEIGQQEKEKGGPLLPGYFSGQDVRFLTTRHSGSFCQRAFLAPANALRSFFYHPQRFFSRSFLVSVVLLGTRARTLATPGLLAIAFSHLQPLFLEKRNYFASATLPRRKLGPLPRR